MWYYTSNSTSCCFNCRKAWKGGGTCGCSNPDIVSMGKKWRAPRASNDTAWKWMEKRRPGARFISEFAYWDQKNPEQYRQAARIPDPDQLRAWAAKKAAWKKKSRDFRSEAWYASEEVKRRIKADHKALRAKINKRRKS